MIIHQPLITSKDGDTILYTRFEMNIARENFPGYIWFRTPDMYGKYFSTSNDAFLILGVMAGMLFNENIEVKGIVSPKLAYQLNEFQFLLTFFLPDHFSHKVKIKYDRLEAAPYHPKGVGVPFSGGVDSLFTLFKHIPQNMPDPNFQVTHGIFIHGFDLLPSQKEGYLLLYKKFKSATTEIGLQLIPLSTNMVSITHGRISRLNINGPLLISAALSLSELFRSFYNTCNDDYFLIQKRTKLTTEDPLISMLLSTETLGIISHGASSQRTEKVREISEWEFARKVLWVCWSHREILDLNNCCRCEKCVRTMIPLFILKQLDAFPTFPKGFRSNMDTLRWAWSYSPREEYESEILTFCRKHMPDLLPWLRIAAIFGTIRWLLTRLVPKFLAKRLRRFGYYYKLPNSSHEYEVPEISTFLESQL